MTKQANEQKSYYAVVQALGRKREGATAADISAATALPLSTVRELLPKAADEYQGRLRVTESGEILYSFPRGFTSRRRGFWAGFKRFCEKFSAGIVWLGSFLFKVWIMVMLIGYFALFMAIAVFGFFASVAATGSNKPGSRRRSVYIGPNFFNLIFRLWFYSELSKSFDRRYDNAPRQKKPPSRPLHRAIFAFVFGDGDPNKDWPAREGTAAIAYVQANRGVISLPEFMALTGKDSGEAAEALMAFCAEFGGSPEATDEGTIVYRFDELLLRAGREHPAAEEGHAGLAPPLRRLKVFSENPKKMNVWFGIINAVNLLFGAYFLYHAVGTEAMPLVGIWLGLVPLTFSVLFWLVPGLRFFREKKENEETKLGNFKRLGYSSIWAAPLDVGAARFGAAADECRPAQLAEAQERVIMGMGAYSVPEVETNTAGQTLYSFTELEREKAALEKYRAGIESADIGKTVFDSE